VVRGLFPGDLIAGYSTVVSWPGGSMGGSMNWGYVKTAKLLLPNLTLTKLDPSMVSPGSRKQKWPALEISSGRDPRYIPRNGE